MAQSAIPEKFVVEWYGTITERERKDLIGAIPRTMEYGLTRNYMFLPDTAKQILRDTFRQTLADHCEPNGSPCLCAACRSVRQ